MIKKAIPVQEEVQAETTYIKDLEINGTLKNNLFQKGYERLTKIQDQTLEPLSQGRDLIGIANTGTGKTAGFLIPIIQQMIEQRQRFQATIIVPTRELALQVEEEFKSIAKGLPLYSASFIGGTNINMDYRKLKRFNHIIIGTPGRILDLMNRGKLNFRHTEILVLDEFDRMLDMGFVNDVKKITAGIRKRRQTMLFSATIDPKQKNLISTFVQDPVRVSVNSGSKSADNINQDIIKVPEGSNKMNLLKDMIQKDDFEKVLIFAETKRIVNKIGKSLISSGVLADVIHGNKSQNYRTKALNKFRLGKVQVLVATDVAARGLDVNDVSHVINYQLPMTMDSYIHRIGRTGRAGKTGQAYTLID